VGRGIASTEHPFPGREHDWRLIVDLKARGSGDAFYIIQDTLSALIAAGSTALQDFDPPGKEVGKAVPKELNWLNVHAARSVANKTNSTKLAKSTRISQHHDNVG
jgi:hypothetical protein